MATASPPPNSSTSALPPGSTTPLPPSTSNSQPPFTTSPPPQSSSSPPDPPTISPPSQPNANPTDLSAPSSLSPPPQSPPSAVVATPPPSTPSTSPPPTSPPPPSLNADPPTSNSPPPPSQAASPPISSPPPSPPSNSTSPPPTPNPPTSSSPPPTTTPPANSPPPTSPNPPLPSSKPPENSPPPTNSPPPPPVSVTPPKSSPPPANSVPPPASTPPKSSPRPANSPPPASTAPSNSPPPPESIAPTPSNVPSPPRQTPNSPPSQQAPSPLNSTRVSPPSPVIRLGPPPPSFNSPPSSDNNTIPSASRSSNSTDFGGIGTVGVVAIGVAVGIIMLSLVGLAVWCLRKRRKDALRHNGSYVMPSSLGFSPRSDSNFTKTQSAAPLMESGSSNDVFVYSPSDPGGLGNSRSWFTYEELLKATNGFSSQNLLGEGGFGSVYKGCLPDGREVAVKQLKVGGGQGEREFKAEVEIISRIHHRHLVSLVGHCISDNRRLLVYDYVPNNTLHFHLHEEGRPVLDWATRVKIAVGAARGIAYLHEDCHPRVIHRDIKSSNILLDNNFEAKVSDFGLAKLAFDANTHVTTRVMGTFGYMAPEYASSGKLTEKSDVFSYGVVLLELITGRKPVDASQPLGDESLVEWARPLLGHALANEEFDGWVDPRLEKNYDESEMFRMIEAAAACVWHSAARRPRMGQVVRAFNSLATADLSNGMRVGESEAFNTAEQSAEIRLFRRMAFGSQNYSTDFFIQGSVDS
ncbi:hypothetical protein P3X46_031275 [Hevea brasiliensis]|uniref:non-specific serine/threonine protein kinase n=1 Tax=Hevea brasiliensis TaxID=3981 RepID=A0ABQ9KMT7_HEVBR|nr:proline-rich receptor-like protein kinase PERK9 [Hevea brasiliensis]XP_057995314.1 proline-rich receptor-like protein kinase PERK9 [Hevea brasiliensis]KAJ9140656.1 hypothetical protein P3X46_031275 [Hevea brasiliensis]